MAPERDDWRVATWEGAAFENLLAGSRLSLPEKLLWLEEMGRVAERLAIEKRSSSDTEPRSEH